MTSELIDWHKQYYYKNNLSREELNDGFVSKIIFRIICSNCKSLISVFEQRERYIGNRFIFYYEYNKQKYCQNCGFQNLYDFNEEIKGI